MFQQIEHASDRSGWRGTFSNCRSRTLINLRSEAANMEISRKRTVRFNENDAVHATQSPFDECKDRWYSVS
jgi:hypothetical protein